MTRVFALSVLFALAIPSAGFPSEAGSAVALGMGRAETESALLQQGFSRINGGIWIKGGYHLDDGKNMPLQCGSPLLKTAESVASSSANPCFWDHVPNPGSSCIAIDYGYDGKVKGVIQVDINAQHQRHVSGAPEACHTVGQTWMKRFPAPQGAQ